MSSSSNVPRPTRAAGYVRVSTDEQAKNGWNLDADRERINDIAAANGWDLIALHDDGAGRVMTPTGPASTRCSTRSTAPT